MNTQEEKEKTYNSRNADKFVVRLPEGMRQRIAEVAKNYHRSMNSEIVSRLESSLRCEPCIQHEFKEGAGGDVVNAIEALIGDTITLELTQEEFALIEKVRQLDNTKRQALLEFLTVAH